MAEQAPRPGMGQDEKDRLGLAQLRAAERGGWTPDWQLDDLTAAELADEASRRRVPVSASEAKSKDKLLKAVRAVDDDPEPRPEPEVAELEAAAEQSDDQAEGE